MRGIHDEQTDLFSYVQLEERIPQSHPLRKIRQMVDLVLASMDELFDSRYSAIGRPPIPPEQLLRASLLQVLYSIRSERLLVEQLDYNLLFRWFVGLSIDARIWDHSTFSQNRDRLFTEEVARSFFLRVRTLAEWGKLTSDEHFSVDGTLIDAWASHKSFVRKDDDSPPPSDGSRNPNVDFHGDKRSNKTHQSRTDPEAKLMRKSSGDASRLCHMAHILMENRNGLIVDVTVSEANGTAERQEALRMLARNAKRGSTVGADKGYDTRDFVRGCRKLGITPHVASKKSGSAIDGRTTRHPGYQVSQRIRKRIEEGFGWLKTVAGLRKTKLIGRAKLAGQTLLAFATYNLIRMGSLSGAWGGSHV
ncbi:IS5 family transposase [Pseudogulbenkiania subflava]|uniref:Transposase n=1 Tax=Pseudogulbenkiania subflava DSM 22618 TaxID=1123014 RepID=A0A1Y6BLG8_9NEIS|nr:IS5 family transposase [Pseudogulbenkiania subflava]SMF13846.1 Transposase [Pseudogulbenkiania subflava DSM 22618]